MARASARAALRKIRQERNKASLTTVQKKDESACRLFIAFGGKRGHKTNDRSFESFIAQQH